MTAIADNPNSFARLTISSGWDAPSRNGGIGVDNGARHLSIMADMLLFGKVMVKMEMVMGYLDRVTTLMEQQVEMSFKSILMLHLINSIHQ